MPCSSWVTLCCWEVVTTPAFWACNCCLLAKRSFISASVIRKLLPLVPDIPRINWKGKQEIVIQNQNTKRYLFNLKMLEIWAHLITKCYVDLGVIWKIFSWGFQNRSYFLKYVVLRIAKLTQKLSTYRRSLTNFHTFTKNSWNCRCSNEKKSDFLQLCMYFL